MIDFAISPLKCPDCGKPLSGMDQDVIFFCWNCLVGYEIENGKFNMRNIEIIPPPENADPASYLWAPMWAFKTTSKFNAPRQSGKQVERILAASPWVWVTAFKTWRASYFGDPGMIYTARSLVPQTTAPVKDAMPVGCSLSEKEAREYVEPFLLSIVDRQVDVAPITITPEVVETKLVSVPFVDEGDKISDTIVKWSWPAIFIEDLVSLQEIRRTQR
jgi:hypothetical protein